MHRPFRMKIFKPNAFQGDLEHCILPHPGIASPAISGKESMAANQSDVACHLILKEG